MFGKEERRLQFCVSGKMRILEGRDEMENQTGRSRSEEKKYMNICSVG